MSSLSTEVRNAFLAETQIAVLSWLSASGAPVSVPIWFEWDGEAAHMFTSKSYAKVPRLTADPRASLLVARPAGEIEEWVALDGQIAFSEEGVADLVSRLAARYWDLDDPYAQGTLTEWLKNIDSMLHMTLTPSRIRSYTK